MTDRVAIIGSRSLDTPEVRKLVFKAVRRAVQNDPDVVIISGGAIGPDRFGAEAARQMRREPIEHLPEWNKYGKRAAFLRNQTIVDDATMVVAWWDGVSNGTIDALRRAMEKGIPIYLWYAPTKKWISTRDGILALTGPLDRPRRAPPRRTHDAEGASPAAWVGTYQLRKRLAGA